MTRNRKGWLRAETLMAGEREQWATDTKSSGRVVVELLYDGEQHEMDGGKLPGTPGAGHLWLTIITSTKEQDGWEQAPGLDLWSASWRSYRLEAARTKFNELIRKYNR